MTLLRSLFLVVATTAVAACGSDPSLPGTDPDIDGELSEFLGGVPSLDAPTNVLVEADLPKPWDRTIVNVGKEAAVYLVGARGQLVPTDRGVFAVGDRLRVWTTGVEARSYPHQVTAMRVYIIR